VTANPDSQSSLPSAPHPEVEVLARGCVASGGHYDELRGGVSGNAAQSSQAASQSQSQSQTQGQSQAQSQTGSSAQGLPVRSMQPVWQEFFSRSDVRGSADLNQRYASLQRQVRDNGVTYNVYADQEGPQRPWSLDLFPLIVDAASWRGIEAGVQQRMRLLEAIMADVYGPQALLQQGLLPASLVHGHPGYLRTMHGVRPASGVHLHVAAFDLARGPDGLWWMVGQRAQAPSGLGYLLENRLAVSRQFPQAFQGMQVQRLAATYRALMNSLKRMSPAGEQAHIALLTPGPYNETYFEHAYLARYLGLTLVEGNDLVVRDEHLFLKTLNGLVPVHGLLKRVDDQYMDPLELRADSTLGVPGLLQAIRVGNVLVANVPGSAFLESPALLGFMPELARALLNEELLLPALPTWWCGEESVMQEVLPRLQSHTIKPTFQGADYHEIFESVLGHQLQSAGLAQWAQRIARQGDEYTVQAYMPLSQMPTWQSAAGADATGGRMLARSVLLRVFAVSDGLGENGQARWRVLPGGLARVAGASVDIAAMQRGGSSADVWVLAEGEVDTVTLLQPNTQPAPTPRRQRLVTSRAAENLYWLGRYTERTENTTRLARIALECLGGEDQTSEPLLQWLGRMALANTLVLPGVPSPLQAPRVFERSLVASLGATNAATSVGYNLRALKLAASSVRERLSQEHWSVIVRAEEELFSRCTEHAALGDYSAASALRTLKTLSDYLAAITGAQTDRMTRDDGWRLLSIGRHVERLAFLTQALALGIELGSLQIDGGFEAMLSLFDSTITFRAQYQQSRDMAALTDTLVTDRDNPRSLAWVAHTLRGRLAKLAGTPQGVLGRLSHLVPDPADWEFGGSDALVEPVTLSELLLTLRQSAGRVSDEISATYFTHSGQTKQSLGN
jgi:uncharacterized circularly permuted ATP-grasp superfamily protein/uncharacterized alpha-E superfamily protein